MSTTLLPVSISYSHFQEWEIDEESLKNLPQVS